MKRTKVYFVIFLVFVMVCCQKDQMKYQSEGIILGPDLRMCACCGGWLITIDTITYRFNSLPDKANIDLQNVAFPIKVSLNWTLSDKPVCSDKLIEIQEIVIVL